METYAINFVNNSGQEGTVCVFQQDPGMSVPNILSLAWLVQPTYPNTSTNLNWQESYSFICGQTGQLFPGITFQASEALPASLNNNNMVTLTSYQSMGSFVDQQTTQPGSLIINCDMTIPPNQYSVGIGMSNSGTFAVQAQPNMRYVFTPHPQYWIAFGNFEQAMVFDPGQVGDAVPVQFPPSVHTMNVTLNPDGSWMVAAGNN